MVKESLVFKLYVSIAARWKELYKKSFINSIVAAFLNFCRGIWSGSFINRLLFVPFGMEASLKKGLSGRIFSKISASFDRISSKTKNSVAQSVIIRYFGGLLDSLLNLPFRSYGCFFLTFGSAAVIYRIISSQASGIMFYIPIAAAVLGLVLMPFDSSLAAISNKSFFIRLVLGFFGVESLSEQKPESSFYSFFIAFGAVCSLLYSRLSPLYFLFTAAAFLGFLAVMYKTEIGIFATALMIPILPTTYVYALAALTVFSFICKLFTGEEKIKFQLIDLFVALFTIVLAISPVISYMPGSTLMVSLKYLLSIAFYFAVKNSIKTKAQLAAVFSFLALSGLAVSVYGIYQQITGDYILTEAWIDITMFEEATQRIYSTLDNPNVLGEYLLFVIPVALAMLYYFKNAFYKLISLGILGAAAVCMIFCQSRGAWLGLLLAVVIFVCLKDRRLIWLAIIALPIVVMLTPDSIMSRFTSIGDLADSSTSYRVNIWLASLVMIKTFWPSGIGLGTDAFEFIYQKYSYNAVYAPHSHNLFLQIIIDLGIVGILIFLFLMATFFKDLLITVRKTKDRLLTPFSAALCAAMGGYLLQGFTDNVWYNNRIVAFFWMILALSGVIKNLADADKEVQNG